MTASSKPLEYEYERPWLYPKQLEAMFCPKRYVFINASTKSGKTVSAMVWLTEQAMLGKEGRNYWWVSPILAQSRIAFRRLKQAIPRILYTANETDCTLTLFNGAIIWFKGSDHPDSLYGEDVYAAVIDEASRCREESWHAVRSTLTATRGPIRVIGNVKGRKNWAYQMAMRAQAGEKDMAFFRITAYDAVEGGVLAADEIDDAQRVLPEAVFKELYLAEASDDEGNPFGITAIQRCILPALSPAPVVCWGWDLAKKRDWTVGIGLDADMKVAAFERWQAPWELTQPKILQITNGLPALVDSTGVGDPIVERLIRDGSGNFAGYNFTPRSKQQLMEGLAVGIQRIEVGFPDGPIVSELESFEYEYTRTGVKYTAPAGMHDDCVCGLALAYRRGYRHTMNWDNAYRITACGTCGHRYILDPDDRPCPRCGSIPAKITVIGEYVADDPDQLDAASIIAAVTGKVKATLTFDKDEKPDPTEESWEAAYSIATCKFCGHKFQDSTHDRACPRCGRLERLR